MKDITLKKLNSEVETWHAYVTMSCTIAKSGICAKQFRRTLRSASSMKLRNFGRKVAPRLTGAVIILNTRLPSLAQAARSRLCFFVRIWVANSHRNLYLAIDKVTPEHGIINARNKKQ